MIKNANSAKNIAIEAVKKDEKFIEVLKRIEEVAKLGLFEMSFSYDDRERLNLNQHNIKTALAFLGFTIDDFCIIKWDHHAK